MQITNFETFTLNSIPNPQLSSQKNRQIDRFKRLINF